MAAVEVSSPRRGSSSVDSRYVHLLQPIRDLAKSWNIDIASELEDYLDELEGIRITFSGGKDLNFAEAALLIQGSAVVYSKKVEYLYLLSFQALNLVTSKKKQTARGGTSSITIDGVDTDVTFGSGEDDFTPLDDILEASSSGINLFDSVIKAVAPPNPPTPLATLSVDKDALTHSITKTPLGSGRKSIGAGILNSCSIHASGTLLLEEKDLCLDIDLERPDPSLQALASASNAVAAALESAANERAESRRSEMLLDTAEENDIPFTGFDDLGGGHESDLESEGGREIVEIGATDQQMNSSAAAKNQAATIKKTSAVLDPHSTAGVKPRPFRKLRAVTKLKNSTSSRASKHLFREAYVFEVPEVTSLFNSIYPEFQEYVEAEKRFKRGEQAARTEDAKIFAKAPVFDVEEDDEEEEDLHNFAGDGFDAADEDEDADGFDVNPSQELFEDNVTELSRRLNDQMETASRQLHESSELVSRVNDWKLRVQPLLEEEEKHRPFDVNTYGEELKALVTEAEAISTDGNSSGASAKSIMSGKPQYEICRFFLASLQLANLGEVVLERGDSDGGFRIKGVGNAH